MRKLIVVMILGSLLGCGKQSSQTQEIKESIKVVKTAPVLKETLVNIKNYNGELKPREELKVVTPTGGDVKEIYFKNGDRVKNGDVILELTDASTEATYYEAQGKGLKARSTYSTDKISFDKYKKLYDKEIISEDEYLTMKNRFETSLGELKIAEAEYIRAKDNFDRLKVTAKFNGLITDLYVKKYEKIPAQSEILTIVDTSVMEVSIAISGKDTIYCKVGDKAEIVVEEVGKTFEGVVGEINYSSDSDSKKYSVKIYINNKDGELLKGMYAKVKLNQGDVSGIFIPTKAIMIKDLYSYIAVIRENKSIIYKVTPKLTLGDKQLIEFPDYQEGDRVVVEGQYLLNNNDKVKEN